MSTVAFLGTGRMGAPMAQRLLHAGHQLQVYNRDPAKAAPLVAQGARLCPTPQAACEGAEAIFSMVADNAASEAVWCGPAGALSGAFVSGALALECSTLSHAWVTTLCTQVRARGLRYLDAPVTGLPDMAARGELTFLIGADRADLAAAQPLLTAVAHQVLHFGPAGAGTAYKLLVNLLGAVQIASCAETMALAERAGLDASRVADALASGQAGSPQVVRNTRRMARGAHDQDVVFTPALRLKDVGYALEYARELGLVAPFGALAAQMYQELCRRGEQHCNESKIIEVARTPPQEKDGSLAAPT